MDNLLFSWTFICRGQCRIFVLTLLAIARVTLFEDTGSGKCVKSRVEGCQAQPLAGSEKFSLRFCTQGSVTPILWALSNPQAVMTIGSVWEWFHLVSNFAQNYAYLSIQVSELEWRCKSYRWSLRKLFLLTALVFTFEAYG